MQTEQCHRSSGTLDTPQNDIASYCLSYDSRAETDARTKCTCGIVCLQMHACMLLALLSAHVIAVQARVVTTTITKNVVQPICACTGST